MFMFCLFFAFAKIANAQNISLSLEEVQRIGSQVFENECHSQEKWLVQWNEGEDFLSLGIGHFIWYPKGDKGPFQESFLDFLSYAKASGATLPQWLSADPTLPCPWDSREDFLRDQDASQLKELRKFLVETKLIQLNFIVKRLKEALPSILKNIPEQDRARIAFQFNRVAAALLGEYALADYVNFKGLGILSSERYQGQGWGLFQVLDGMRGVDQAPNAMEEFVRSADKVLVERVAHSPYERHEKKWLPGWKKRINSYLAQ
jgi:hypothetical protein